MVGEVGRDDEGRRTNDEGRMTDDEGPGFSSSVIRPSSSFKFRPAKPTDKEEVLALTADTWEGGDYIHWVFDDWVNDATGQFLIAIDEASGRIAGIDKLTLLSPTEAWFEGLRVHPDFRGRGLASSFQTHMINESRRLGAKTLRFLTNVDNLSVHRKGYRDEFNARFVSRHWRWVASGDMSQDGQVGVLPWRLRDATPGEASSVYDWWQRSTSCQASDGLVNRNWSFRETSPEAWMEHARQGELLIPEGTDVVALALPPPIAIVIPGTGDEGNTYWTISLLSATGAEWHALAPALIECAQSRRVTEVEGLVPDGGQAYRALQEAGFETGGPHACLCLFELDLHQE